MKTSKPKPKSNNHKESPPSPDGTKSDQAEDSQILELTLCQTRNKEERELIRQLIV
jgi:hypothetical protein